MLMLDTLDGCTSIYLCVFEFSRRLAAATLVGNESMLWSVNPGNPGLSLEPLAAFHPHLGMSSESKPASSRNKVISCAECRR